MNYTLLKLDHRHAHLAKELFYYFQIDDGVKEPIIPTEEYLKNMLLKKDFHVIIALDDKKIIGGLTAFELPMYKESVNEIFLYEIGVDEEYRQKGIAKALIESLKQLAIEKDIPEMYVGTEMDNFPAQQLYKTTGGKREDIAWYVYTIK